MTSVLDPSKSKPFTRERLEELAADDANRVYDFEHDTVERVLPPHEVRLKLLATRGLVVENMKKHPHWKWQDHKTFIRDNHPTLWEMTRTHPKMFAVASHPNTDARKDFAPILMLIQAKEDELAGRISEKRAMQIVSTTLQDHLKMEKGKTQEDATPWTFETRPDE